MKKDLSKLRMIAESEESQKWGPWAFEEDDFDGYCVYINDGDSFGRSYIAQDISQGGSEGKSTAEFIATFDPPTVLALLSRLEQAEADVVNWKATAISRGERLEQAEQIVTIRESELLELKGKCSNPECRLHRAHSGPYDCIALDGDTRRCLECNGTGDVQVQFNHGIQTQDCAVCFGTGDTRG